MRPPQWAVVAPIEVEELTKTIKDMNPESATDPDNISVCLIRVMPRLLLAALLNLWLFVGKIPAPLKHTRTVLIPKFPGAAQPQQHRPITIAPAVVRCYTQLMAKRTASLCSLHPAQRAFTEVDGTAENITLLAALMRDAQQKLQPMAVAWLDMAKAFDSVSHHSIKRAARRAGLPPPAVRVVEDLYQDATTKIRRDIRIHTTRGVRQGDSWSPWLFNAVVDEVVVA